MSDNNFIDHSRPISIRFTEHEAEFINENYERIAGTEERVTMRDFFFSSVEKAVSRVAPKVAEASRPEDIREIEALKLKLQEALTDIENKTAAITEISQRNVEQDQEIDRLNAVIVQCKENATTQVQEYERAISEVRPKENTLILEMLPVEMALIQEYSRIMKTTPKNVLIDKLFVRTVWHGPGDYIPRLNSEAKRKLREAFK